jgi:hypothetical protein
MQIFLKHQTTYKKHKIKHNNGQYTFLLLMLFFMSLVCFPVNNTSP